MSQIWYAAYGDEFVEPAREIFKKLGRDVCVTVWNPELVPEMLRSGVRVIMGRGATAKRIRAAVNVPVVDIPIPFEDMVRTIIEASRYGTQIGVIGYDNLLSGLELLNPILNVNIRQVFAIDPEDTYRQIGKLKDEGVKVIVGGAIQTRFAREQGLMSVRLDLSEKALSYACSRAEELLVSVRAQARQSEEFKTILNTTREKYIAVDRKGAITWMNRTAKSYLPYPDARVYETLLTEIFPEFSRINEVLETGEEILQETASITGTDILYDMIPLIYEGNEILGAVVTFNDSHTITRGEQKIRDKGAKGFQAAYQFKDICGKSAPMETCIQFAKKYAREDFSVLLLGESGSGKELFAQSIHNASSRRDGPFVAVNCAALPEGILESELFGYDEGAFTGARRKGKRGLFELAHNGTIFLDEIGEMPLSLQSRLLRVLQEKKVMRLGGDRIFPVNVRIIAATNQDLIELMKERRFREDLFYRLNVLTLRIPPLRERREDIVDLAKLFLKESAPGCSLSPAAIREMKDYGWPGNTRQLRHFMEKLRILGDSPVISGETARYVIENFEPPCGEEAKKPRENDLEAPGEKPEDTEARRLNLPAESAVISKDILLEVLERAGGNQSRAARELGVHRSTIWRYIKKYGI